MEKMYKVTAIVDGVKREVDMTSDMLWRAWDLKEDEIAEQDIRDYVELVDDDQNLIDSEETMKELISLYRKVMYADIESSSSLAECALEMWLNRNKQKEV